MGFVGSGSKQSPVFIGDRVIRRYFQHQSVVKLIRNPAENPGFNGMDRELPIPFKQGPKQLISSIRIPLPVKPRRNGPSSIVVRRVVEVFAADNDPVSSKNPPIALNMESVFPNFTQPAKIVCGL